MMGLGTFFLGTTFGLFISNNIGYALVMAVVSVVCFALAADPPDTGKYDI